ncbi:hypothetical protein F8388_016817 [Cannabis sativa]|uniref:DUF4220 domain-containing protein n=1 Tax=Cannabis sativa TaxID=3483 RepID=A0A7J6ERK1_CANSA|nr:hypothetical protein F8388_016817 [Cannabis sativa]
MSSVINSTVEKLLKVTMLVSLSLQAFLLVLAPVRKWSRSNLIARFVWAFYLVADWIAATIIGQIIKSIVKGDDTKDNQDDHYSLWASFLLMHLGGPDTITSLSLEDNELWIRHLFGLILQVISAVFTLYRRGTKNRLLWPNILVFIVGVIKFGERTWALRLASLKKFGETNLPDPNPGPDYQEAQQVYSTMRTVHVKSTITEMMASTMSGGVSNYGHTQHISDNNQQSSQNLQELKLLKVAYAHYETFKGLIVGFLLSSKDRESSRSYFLHENAARAFRLVEYELSFMYQVLHTKAVVIHGIIGYSLRFITICFTVLGFLVFHFIGKHGFNKLDTDVTYVLFIGAIVLDTLSALKLFFSDFVLMGPMGNFISRLFIPKAIMQRKRWSKSVNQKDIISHCLAPKMEFKDMFVYLNKYGEFEVIKRILYNFSYWKPVDNHLKKLIFEELKDKSKKAINLREAMEACSQRGEAALLQNPSSYIKLKWSIGEFQYAESLLLWHLATELCYNDQANSSTSEGDKSCWKLFAERCCRTCVCQGHQDDHQSSVSDHRNICKLISNYMFYLLVNKSVMLAPIMGNWNIVFGDTCADANRFFEKHKLSRHGKVCVKILSVKPKIKSTAMKGERSKSVFFDACILAQQLQNEESQWKIMSQVWVEMLSYAAINCTPFVHAKQLSKGGELLTFTWLLMNHLGLGTQFVEQEHHAGTKMVTVI